MVFVLLKFFQEKRQLFLLYHLNFQRFPNLVLVLGVTIFSQSSLIIEGMVVEKSAEYYLVFSGYYYDETYHYPIG
jgi:hypothetical protein